MSAEDDYDQIKEYIHEMKSALAGIEKKIAEGKESSEALETQFLQSVAGSLFVSTQLHSFIKQLNARHPEMFIKIERKSSNVQINANRQESRLSQPMSEDLQRGGSPTEGAPEEEKKAEALEQGPDLRHEAAKYMAQLTEQAKMTYQSLGPYNYGKVAADKQLELRGPKVQIDNDTVYEGQWIIGGNIKQGVGLAVFKGGQLYEGGWHDDVEHGKGRLIHENGECYDGEWKNG